MNISDLKKKISALGTNKKNYCVIGMGRFGSEIARILLSENQRILVIDNDDKKISEMGNDFPDVRYLDACNIHNLSDVGVQDYDKVIVGVSDFEKSITICSNLRELGVKNIIAKASALIHRRILKSMGVSQVIIPELEIASKITYQIIYGINIDMFSFDVSSNGVTNNKCFILEIPVNNADLWKKQVLSIDLTKTLNSTIIAIRRSSGEILVPIKGQDIINRGDTVYVITLNKYVENIIRFFKNKTL